MQNVISRPYAITAIIIALTAGAHAQGPAPSPLISLPSPPPAKVPAVAAQPSPAPLFTRQDFETFLDALIPSQLQNRDIAGAVVSVVKDGQVLFAKGYGYADFAAKKPVLADQTLFRPGSISKLFTATAVMQLVEQGKLDLDRDVNEYLDFAIPKTYPEPVTLRRLLTHTAGFEDTLKNLFVAHESDMKALRTYLVNQMPQRIFPPGKIPSYSNYGFSVAGYIVERVSGEKFERYIDNHILKPLRMTNSTFDQPLPVALTPQMSQGYLAAAKKPRDFEFVQAAPAGALSTTAADMTRFMLAFANRYFSRPSEPKANVDPNTAKMDGRAVSGVYEGTRRGETTLLKLLALLDQFGVSSDKEGVLTVEGMKNQRGETKKWREIAPLVYGEIDGPEKIAFRRNPSGDVSEMLPFPAIYEGQRVPWYASKRLVNPVVGGNLLLVLLTVLLWPVAVIVRNRYQRPLFTAKADRALYFLSRIVCLCELLFILVPVIAFSRGLQNIVLLGDAIDPWLQALHIFGWATTAGIVVLIVASIRFIRLPGHGFWFRAHAILLALGGIAFGLFCRQYHLLDASLKF